MKYKRGGENIVYRMSKLIRSKNQSMVYNYYSLSFTHTFKSDEGRVFFAYSYPYTYSQLLHFLRQSCVLNLLQEGQKDFV